MISPYRRVRISHSQISRPIRTYSIQTQQCGGQRDQCVWWLLPIIYRRPLQWPRSSSHSPSSACWPAHSSSSVTSAAAWTSASTATYLTYQLSVVDHSRLIIAHCNLLLLLLSHETRLTGGRDRWTLTLMRCDWMLTCDTHRLIQLHHFLTGRGTRAPWSKYMHAYSRSVHLLLVLITGVYSHCISLISIGTEQISCI